MKKKKTLINDEAINYLNDNDLARFLIFTKYLYDFEESQIQVCLYSIPFLGETDEKVKKRNQCRNKLIELNLTKEEIEDFSKDLKIPPDYLNDILNKNIELNNRLLNG